MYTSIEAVDMPLLKGSEANEPAAATGLQNLRGDR
jgi:hypothetical protein